MNALQSHCLCSHHNNLLADYDTEGGRFYEAIASIRQDSSWRDKLGPIPGTGTTRYNIDGRRLEGWFLKTAVNILAQGKLDYSRLPAEMIAALFNGIDFAEPAGLSSGGVVGTRFQPKTEIAFAPLIPREQPDRPIGGLFTIFGLLFRVLFQTVEPYLHQDAQLPHGPMIQARSNTWSWHPETISQASSATSKRKTVQRIRIIW